MARKFDWMAALIPGYGQYKAMKNTINNINSDGFQLADLFGFWSQEPDVVDQTIETTMDQIQNTSREEYIKDRDHTEEREDTAYQRATKDMLAAGLNPYTIGASPASSSASNVGENTIASKLQLLGYVLDLKNLSLKNRQVTNQSIGNLIKLVK